MAAMEWVWWVPASMLGEPSVLLQPAGQVVPVQGFAEPLGHGQATDSAPRAAEVRTYRWHRLLAAPAQPDSTGLGGRPDHSLGPPKATSSAGLAATQIRPSLGAAIVPGVVLGPPSQDPRKPY